MFLKNTKRINEEISSYTNLLANIQNLLFKDENYTSSYLDSNLSTVFLDRREQKISFPNDLRLPIDSGKIRVYENQFKSRFILPKEEHELLYHYYEDSVSEDSMFGDLKNLYKSIKSIFSKNSKPLGNKELREKFIQLKAERKEALEQLYKKILKLKNHLEKSRSLYNLLVDLRENLRRIIRKFINAFLDDEEKAYLISINVFTHRKIELNNNFFNISKNESKYYKCYSACIK